MSLRKLLNFAGIGRKSSENRPADIDILAEARDSHLRRRCVFLRGQITEDAATVCIAQLLYLQKKSADQPVTIYIDSLGGLITAAIAIIRTMDDMSFRISTHCCGDAGGAAAIILAHGRPGFRSSEPDRKIGFSSVVPAAPEMAYPESALSQFYTALAEILAEDLNKHQIEVLSWMYCNREFSVSEALELGIIDRISLRPRD